MPASKKQPTIYDVAKRADVSITTVSRILNAPDKVNGKTRERVLRAIDKLGFVPKAEARARALQKSGRIGVITPFFTAPSFVQRLRGIAQVLSKENYGLVVYSVDSAERLNHYLSSLALTGGLDGLIIMSLRVAPADAQRLVDNGLAVVFIEYPHPEINSVEIDDVHGGRLAAEYLISKGHRRIAFFGDTDLPEYLMHPVAQRLQGFRQVLHEMGLGLPKDFVCLAPYTQEQTRLIAHQLLTGAQPPTAIFSATDFQAVGVLKAARQLDVKVPDQLAVVGFDDLDLAEFLDLTTIRQHLDESGRLAAEILLAQIADPTRPAHHVRLPLTLVERLTT